MDKRAGEGGNKTGLSAVSAPPLHPRKPPPRRSPTPSTSSYSKALTPLPIAPLSSPSGVTTLKSEEHPKTEKPFPQQSYSHPSTPAPHTPSPASASPSTPSPIRPKEESVEVAEKEGLELQKQASAPFQSMYPGKPPLSHTCGRPT